MLLTKFKDSDFVSAKLITKILNTISDLKKYCDTIPDVLRITVAPVGSFTTGLASSHDSSIDILMRLDGGELTASLNSDQLSLALAAALNDWSGLLTIKQVGNQSGIAICQLRGSFRKIKIHACNAGNAPLSYIYHSKLFSSYAYCNSKVPIIVGLVKRWARAYGLSAEVASNECPLTGFHWTVISLHFLVHVAKILPNLHSCEPNQMPDLVRLQFGPHYEHHSFTDIPNVTVGRELCKSVQRGRLRSSDSTTELLVHFFEWLANIDLLSKSISLQTNSPAACTTNGWLCIIDPCLPNYVNSVSSDISQKANVLAGMLISRAARNAPRANDEEAWNEYIFSKHLPTSNDVSLKLVDVAVP